MSGEPAPVASLDRALRAGATAGLLYGGAAGLVAAWVVARAPGVLRPVGAGAAWLPLHHWSLLAALGGAVGLLAGATLARARRPLPAALALGAAVTVAAPAFVHVNVHWLPELAKPLSLLGNAALLAAAGLVAAALFVALRGLEREPPRWRWLCVGLLLAGAPVVLIATAGGRAAAEVGGPAIAIERAPPATLVLITIDTLRADHLGCYGYDRDTSPRLDRLASEGTLFTRAFSHAPNTHPSMAAMLTGEPLSAFDHHALADFVPDGTETVAERMRGRGYRTLGVVANPWLKSEMGFGQGFDRYDDRSALVQGAEQVTDIALAMLDGEPERVFLWLHYLDPHHPYTPPPDADRFGPPVASMEGLKREPDMNRRMQEAAATGAWSPAEWQRLVDLYDGEIWHTDREIGRLLDGLEARGRLEDARVVITADHGEEFLDHGGVLHSHSLYAELVRLPLIVWSSTERSERRDDRLVAARAMEELLLIGEPAGGGAVIAEKLHRTPRIRGPLVSVRDDRWTLVVPAYRPRPFSLEARRVRRMLRELVLFAPVAFDAELFRADDRTDADDRAAERPDLLPDLENELRALYRTRRLPIGGDRLPSDETVEQLEGLGYLGR